MDTLSFIIALLSSNAVVSLATWLVSRRKRNNDFLGELQQSIDLLSKKYSEVLNENVQLKTDNAQLLANQEEMRLTIEKMNSKLDELRRQLKKFANDNTKKDLPADVVMPCDGLRIDSSNNPRVANRSYRQRARNSLDVRACGHDRSSPEANDNGANDGGDNHPDAAACDDNDIDTCC